MSALIDWPARRAMQDLPETGKKTPNLRMIGIAPPRIGNFRPARGFSRKTNRFGSFAMLTKIATVLMTALMAGGMLACTSNPEGEEGSFERAAQNAGRVADDSVITAKVKSALAADPTTKAHQINVETFQGKVQLSGFVDDDEARRRASQIAQDIEGVREVKNSLQVRDSG
ncbi:MAG TPA: BON domain-containing protein [Steroidobacteraceae bacterium]